MFIWLTNSVRKSGNSHSSQTHSELSKSDSGPPISAEPAHTNRVEFSSRNSDPMYMFPPFPLLSKVIQKHRITQDLIAPLVTVTTMVSICVWTTLSSFRIPRTHCHNRDMSWMASHIICTHGGSHAALPSSRIFKRGLLTRGSCRRPSTNRLYDDRWLHFTYWATGHGIDPHGPTAAQKPPFYIISLTLMACHLIL